MFNNIITVICLFSIVYYTNAAPSVEVQRCNGEDSNCIKDSAIKLAPLFISGIPAIGIKPLDPLNIDSVDASTNGLLFKIKDAVVTGLNHCEFKKVARDVKESKLFVDLICNALLEGQYDINGRVLVIPIEGNGKITANLKKLELNIVAETTLKKGKDGKQHWSIKKWNYTYDLKEKSELNFENLFPGNAVLGQAARDVISQNGNEVIKDIGGPVIKSIIGKVVEHVQRFFKSIPVEDLEIS